MIIEGAAVLLFGLYGARWSYQRRQEHLKKKAHEAWLGQYPIQGKASAKKGKRLILSCEPNESMVILQAQYGEHNLTAWVQDHMTDTNFWEFLLIDELLGVTQTPDDTVLTVEWELQPHTEKK